MFGSRFDVNLLSLLGIQGLSPLHDPARFRCRFKLTSGRRSLLSAAPISRLRRARAQEGGTILFFGFLNQAKFRSAHLDPRELSGPED